MRCLYVAMFAAKGLALPENEPDVHFLDSASTSTTAILTRNPDEKLYIVDRGLALKTLLLSAIFHTPDVRHFDEKLSERIHQVRNDRARATGSAPTLIVTVELDAILPSAAKRIDHGDFSVWLDSFDKAGVSSILSIILSSTSVSS